MWREFLEALRLGTVAHGGYQDGRAVDLRAAAEKTLYLVGDVHAKPHRITEILCHARLEPALESEHAVLVFLGDLFHREDDARAGEMESSLETFEAIARLKTRFPRSVYTLLGNHELTRTESTKRGYFQGELFRRALEQRGLAETYDRFLQASPLLVIHPRLVGVHAGSGGQRAVAGTTQASSCPGRRAFRAGRGSARVTLQPSRGLVAEPPQKL